MSIQELRDKIAKKAKGTHVSVLSESEIAVSGELISTPAYDLNRILSGSLFKGMRSKVFTLFVGPEATGKSSFMCLCLAEAQKQGYTPIVIDTEGSWTNDFVSRWGMNADDILYIYTPWIDKITIILGQLIDSGDTKLAVVIDSIGGMEKYKLIEDSVDGDPKADQGALQKEIKRMLKMLVYLCKGQDSIVMAAGHYYGSPSSYGASEDIGGGKYLKLAADVIVSLKKSKLFDNGDRSKIIGNTIKAIAMKNRFYPPFQEALIEISYQNGINSYAGMMDLAVEAGLVEKGGSWYTVNGEKYQGETKAIEGFRQDKIILTKLDEWLKMTGYSTVNKNIENAMKIIEETEAEEEQKFREEVEEDLSRPDKKVNGKIKKK
jgi:recombination protein RecA